MNREHRLLAEALAYFIYGAMVLCIVAWVPLYMVMGAMKALVLWLKGFTW